MASSLSLLVALVAMTTTSAHICLLSPPQRGTMKGLHQHGNPDCGLGTGPCGGRPAETGFIFRRGEHYNMTFQQNLNHFEPSNPGYFTVGFGTEDDVVEILRFSDTPLPNYHLHTVAITFPDFTPGKYILQVTYVTHSPEADPTFYQCSDFTLV